MTRSVLRALITVGHVDRAVDLQDLRFVQALEQVAETVDDHLEADDEHALAYVIPPKYLEQAAQAQDHIAPALAAWRTKIELPDQGALRVELGKARSDSGAGVAVENAKFLFAQALIDQHRVRRQAQGGRDRDAGLLRAHEGRSHQDVRARGRR